MKTALLTAAATLAALAASTPASLKLENEDASVSAEIMLFKDNTNTATGLKFAAYNGCIDRSNWCGNWATTSCTVGSDYKASVNFKRSTSGVAASIGMDSAGIVKFQSSVGCIGINPTSMSSAEIAGPHTGPQLRLKSGTSTVARIHLDAADKLWIQAPSFVDAAGTTLSCAAGWTGANCDQDEIDCVTTGTESSKTCKNGGTCSETTGSGAAGMSCACAAGWTGANCDVDINECTTASHDCHSLAACGNTDGSYTCTCQNGYTSTDAGRSCDDINECVTNYGTCGSGYTCSNSAGSYSCNNINECTASYNGGCGSNQYCQDTVGSYSCNNYNHWVSVAASNCPTACGSGAGGGTPGYPYCSAHPCNAADQPGAATCPGTAACPVPCYERNFNFVFGPNGLPGSGIQPGMTGSCTVSGNTHCCMATSGSTITALYTSHCYANAGANQVSIWGRRYNCAGSTCTEADAAGSVDSISISC